jgi:ribose transport system substrate-binding protein
MHGKGRRYSFVLWALTAAISVAAVALAACGSTQSSSGGAGSTATPASSAADAVPAAVTEQLSKDSAVPTFTAPGPAFDAHKAAGKTIFNIPFSSSVPFLVTVDKAIQAEAAKYGIKVVEYTNNGTPTEWGRGIQQAINQKASLILLEGAPDPRLLGPQLSAAKAAGIPVEVTHFLDVSSPTPAGVTAQVPVDFAEAMRLEADQAIAQTGGKADVLVIAAPDIPSAATLHTAIADEFTQQCPHCKVTYANVAIPDWATKVQTTVQSALVSDPNINYVLPEYDSMTQFAAPAIIAAGKAGKVHMATLNGTPFALKMIETGNILSMDIGENLDWLAWADLDQGMRLMLALAPVKSENTPLRVFTKANVADTGTPPVYNKGYGTAYISGYTKLWSGG